MFVLLLSSNCSSYLVEMNLEKLLFEWIFHVFVVQFSNTCYKYEANRFFLHVLVNCTGIGWTLCCVFYLCKHVDVMSMSSQVNGTILDFCSLRELERQRSYFNQWNCRLIRFLHLVIVISHRIKIIVTYNHFYHQIRLTFDMWLNYVAWISISDVVHHNTWTHVTHTRIVCF